MVANRFIFAFLVFLGFSFSAAGQESSMAKKMVQAPSKETVQAWWKVHSNHEMYLYDELEPVVLRSGENAFLTRGRFHSRGRPLDRIMLIRPELNDVRDVKGPAGTDFAVMDIDHDGISEIDSYEMIGHPPLFDEGDGRIVFFQLDGWDTIIIHLAEYTSNVDYCITLRDRACYSKFVKWEFKNSSNGVPAYLIEKTEIKKGKTASKLTTTKTTAKYVYEHGVLSKIMGKKLVPMKQKTCTTLDCGME